MATYNKFRSFAEAAYEAKHDLGANTLKLMLTNTLPVNTNTQKSDITEIAAGNGYVAGGSAITITSSAQAAGVYKLVGDDVVFTATGNVGPFQYIVLYDDTSTNDLLIAWYDYGGPLTLANGETLTIDFSAANGILQHT